MPDNEKRALDAILAINIITPTPWLSPDGPQRGRNHLLLTPLEREIIINRIERVFAKHEA